MPEYLPNVKVSGLQIIGIKLRNTKKLGKTRYRVRCLRCGHQHTVTHHTLQDRVNRKSRYCRKCAFDEEDRFTQVTKLWPAPGPIPTKNDLLVCVCSTGQSGAARAGLDAAQANRIRIGGWCPYGRRVDDGELALRYPLRVTPTAKLSEATHWNVRDTDATIAVGLFEDSHPLSRTYSLRYGKPYLDIALTDGPRPDVLRNWMAAHKVRVLHITGERARNPDIYPEAYTWLLQAFAPEQTQA